MTQTHVVEVAYEAIQGHLDRETTVSLGSVRARDFQRAAAAIGDLNPVYLDDEAARAAGHLACVAPPGYLSAVLAWGWGPPEADLRPDGVVPGTLADAPVDGLRLMGAGQELTFHQDLRDGMQVQMTTRIHDVKMKEGTDGPFLILRISRSYVDEAGTPILECLESFIGK